MPPKKEFIFVHEVLGITILIDSYDKWKARELLRNTVENPSEFILVKEEE